MLVRIAISVIALVLGFGQITFAQSQLVVPGKSVGNFSLGMTRAEVWRQLGKPTQNWILKQDAKLYSEDVWCRKQQNYCYFFTVITDRGSVIQIEVTNPCFKTMKGLSTSDEFSKYRHLYPDMLVNQYLFNSHPDNTDLSGYGEL